MTNEAMSLLPRRMIEHMAIPKLAAKWVDRYAAWVKKHATYKIEQLS